MRHLPQNFAPSFAIGVDRLIGVLADAGVAAALFNLA